MNNYITTINEDPIPWHIYASPCFNSLIVMFCSFRLVCNSSSQCLALNCVHCHAKISYINTIQQSPYYIRCSIFMTDEIWHITWIKTNVWLVNSLWPRDVIWWRKPGLTVAQVMTKASHKTILTYHRGALWHVPESNFKGSTQEFNPKRELENWMFCNHCHVPLVRGLNVSRPLY